MAVKSGAARATREDKSRRNAANVQPVESAAVNLDRLIHERTRLAIVSALAVNDLVDVQRARGELLHVTDGNLSVHARKLEDAGYVGCTKSFSGRLPKTEYRLATAGRRALEKYLDHMEALIRATREG